MVPLLAKFYTETFVVTENKGSCYYKLIPPTELIAMKYNFIPFISLSSCVWTDALLCLLKHEKLIKIFNYARRTGS